MGGNSIFPGGGVRHETVKSLKRNYIAKKCKIRVPWGTAPATPPPGSAPGSGSESIAI